MAHEFLETLVSSGRTAFRIKDANTRKYVPYADAIKAFREVDALLLSWANRGSHTEDVVLAEAEKLIDACEGAISFLKCPDCGKFVHFAETAGGEHQCRCGNLNWK